MKKRSYFSIRHMLFVCSFLAVFAGITLFLFGYHRDEKLFQRLTTNLFEQEMKSSTLNMHYSLASPSDFGIYNYDVILPTYSRELQLSGQATTENALAALQKLDPDKLSSQDAYAYKLLIRSLDNSLNKSQFSYYEEPLAPSSGMQSQLPILLAEYTFRTKKDVTDYLSLLEQTDEYFASLLTYEQEKADAGLLMPATSLQDVITQCDTIVSKDELETGNHFLQSTFQERLQLLLTAGTITQEEALEFAAENDRLLKTVMQPAYEALADGLFLLQGSDQPLTGLGAKPNGTEYYQYLLIAETGSYRSIPEIRKLLSASFQEQYDAIRAIAAAHPEVVAQLSTESFTTLPFTDADAMLADLQNRMRKDFPEYPSSSQPNVTVKAVSASLEPYCAPAFYLTAPIDDTDTNVIYINHKDSPAGLELYTTLAHEGYPGHLYQTVYSNRSFLQNKENKSRQLLWYGGYLEGWALYVEFLSYDYASELMQEQGRDTDALCVQIEKHNRNLQLCLYSLLDIMIHYDNASHSEVAKVLEGFGITNSASVDAVYTYIAEEPCNYLKYYLGYLEILELQKTAQEQWGSNYSDKAFHSFYLDCGPSDFTSLEERLTEYPEPSYQLSERIDSHYAMLSPK